MAAIDVQQAPKLENLMRTLKLSGHVGFDSLPDQLVNKSVQNGFVFNILCIGETGLGKSTLMDSLFNTNFESEPSPHNLPTVKLKANTYELNESSVRLKLTICDTVGYGDQVNKEDSFKAVVDHIDAQFEAYLQEELKIKRSLGSYHDTRLHVCLYFICPTGHGLKSIDLVCMKKLDTKVNIIPIIAKADTISKAELQRFKAKIMQELKENGVEIYQFPVEDESVAEVNASMNAHMPFAVVGSSEFVKIGNKTVRARQYPWGTVQVENETHCDFVKLREMLVRTNMEDLRSTTHDTHYELYRRRHLRQCGFLDTDDNNKPLSFAETFEAKRTAHLAELQARDDEMRQLFVQRVKEKEAELKEAERELHAKFDKLKKDHTEEKKRLEELRKKIEDDTIEFNRRKQQAAQHHHTLTLAAACGNYENRRALQRKQEIILSVVHTITASGATARVFMRQLFVQRVKEKEAELKEAERELHAKFDKLKKDHTEEKKRLEELRKKIEDDTIEFNRRKQQAAQHHHTLTLGKSKKK